MHESLKATAKVINVDQPKGDVFNQSKLFLYHYLTNKFKTRSIFIVIDFVSRPARSHAPITPRILLIGPTGSGRRTQAQALANKYDIVNVSMSNLIKEAVAHESVLGIAIRPHLQKKTNSIFINFY